MSRFYINPIVLLCFQHPSAFLSHHSIPFYFKGNESKAIKNHEATYCMLFNFFLSLWLQLACIGSIQVLSLQKQFHSSLKHKHMLWESVCITSYYCCSKRIYSLFTSVYLCRFHELLTPGYCITFKNPLFLIEVIHTKKLILQGIQNNNNDSCC